MTESEAFAAFVIVFLAVGLWWCYKVPDEADRMYHWGIVLFVFVVLNTVALALEIIRFS